MKTIALILTTELTATERRSIADVGRALDGALADMPGTRAWAEELELALMGVDRPAAVDHLRELAAAFEDAAQRLEDAPQLVLVAGGTSSA